MASQNCCTWFCFARLECSRHSSGREGSTTDLLWITSFSGAITLNNQPGFDFAIVELASSFVLEHRASWTPWTSLSIRAGESRLTARLRIVRKESRVVRHTQNLQLLSQNGLGCPATPCTPAAVVSAASPELQHTERGPSALLRDLEPRH
jgi:hypothetical protein